MIVLMAPAAATVFFIPYAAVQALRLLWSVPVRPAYWTATLLLEATCALYSYGVRPVATAIYWTARGSIAVARWLLSTASALASALLDGTSRAARALLDGISRAARWLIDG